MDVILKESYLRLGGGGGNGGEWWRSRAPTRRPQVSCARKNQHGPARRQANKQWEKLRRGDSRTQGRQWTERAREAMGMSPPVATERLNSLTHDQAFGLVTSAQANFMTVMVQQCRDHPDEDHVELDDQSSDRFSETNTSNRIGTKLLCVVRALLKKIKRRVMVGDRVLVSGVDWIDKRGMIDDVLQRSSETSDPPVANVDLLLVLFALDRPRLDPVVLNRFLVEAESTGIPLAVVLNKADLVSIEVRQSWEMKLMEWGYKPYICSVDSRMGLSELVPVLENKTSIVFGPSGAGKSSLINALRQKEHENQGDLEVSDGEDVRVSEVSLKSGLGRHTTRHVSLLQLPFEGAMLADSPGFSYPSLAMVSRSNLSMLFPEVRSRLEQRTEVCAFLDCQHMSEPGCVVGSNWERYGYYVSLWNEIKLREEHEKNVFGTKQQDEFRFKSGTSGVKQAEPLLAMKKHRRVSRKHTNQLLDDDVWRAKEGEKEDAEADLPD